MGSNFCKQICCGTCGRCQKQEEANEETSETKPILQTSGDTSVCTDKQPSTPALKASEQGSEEVQALCWDQQLSADAAEQSTETCSPRDPMGMTEGWKAAWGSTDFLVASADRETKGEVEVLTQLQNQQEREKASNMEEKIKPVPHASEAQLVMHAAQDVKLAAGIGLMKITGETAAGQDCEIKPPTETEGLIGRNLPLYAVQKTAKETETCPPAEHIEETDRARLAEESPRSTESARIMCLVETAYLLSVQATQESKKTVDPSEVVVNGMAETHSTSAMPQETLYPGGESLEPANQLLDFLQQETQSSVPTAPEMQSLSCAEPAELSEVLCQSSDKDRRVLSDLVEGEENRECDPEIPAGEEEPQQRIVQQTTQLPEEPLACIQMPVKEEAEFLNTAPLLSEVFEGSGGERQVENAEA